ncbi:hypothetical protein [Prosthecobacter vanneervenii]|uniref:Uncharacterized protein n=1 Tax=Prosthecobacter vanneervenii TaxID=48466 RepID=A0A7W7YEC0_9BACT|nr:hypothetical protein [Prosthecobacter vanneervenii]MBB5034645.1 hypothetical protein [Prosthecobacter vanneervenii]
MLPRITRLCIIAALVFSIGLHWVVLQSVAWAGMLVTYTVQQGSLLTGVSQTFDNEHPCPLCHAIKKGRTTEKKKTPPKEPVREMDLALTFPARIILTPPAPFLTPLPELPHAIARRIRPPRPPPRCGGHSFSLG